MHPDEFSEHLAFVRDRIMRDGISDFDIAWKASTDLVASLPLGDNSEIICENIAEALHRIAAGDMASETVQEIREKALVILAWLQSY